MKKLIGFIAISMSLASFNSFAGQITFTTAEFRIVKVSPMCPAPRPGQMTCMALGGTVTVEATLGCLDRLVASHFELADDTLVPTLRAVSVVRQDSDSLRVMCTRMNVVRKTISLSNLSGSKLEIENEEIR